MCRDANNVPEPAAAKPAARRKVRKWDQMPGHIQSSAVAEQGPATAVPGPVSSSAVPVNDDKAAQNPPSQSTVSAEPHESSSEKQQAPASQASELSKLSQANESASTVFGVQYPAVQRSASHETAQVQKGASLALTTASPAVLALVPGCALICACSAQEADESFNKHQLPLPQHLRDAHPNAIIRQGLTIFLHNADTRRLLGPFYARQTDASEEKVRLLT